MDHNSLINEIKGIRRVVINTQHGGFGLSGEGISRYLELLGLTVWKEDNEKYPSLGMATYWLVPPGPDRVEDNPGNWHNMTLAERQAHNQKYSEQVFYDKDIARDDPILVRVVNELGDIAASKYASLKVVEIPAEVDWIIEEYDGAEWVAEKHRTWS